MAADPPTPDANATGRPVQNLVAVGGASGRREENWPADRVGVMPRASRAVVA